MAISAVRPDGTGSDSEPGNWKAALLPPGDLRLAGDKNYP